MKVYKLIQELAKFPADADVLAEAKFSVTTDIDPEDYDMTDPPVLVDAEFDDTLGIEGVTDRGYDSPVIKLFY